MTIAFVPLFAANLDWLEALFVAFVVLSWIGAQIRAVFRRPPPREPPVVRPQAPPAGPPADDDPRAELARQIEAFLRDASGRTPAARDPRRPIETPAEARRRAAAPPPRPPKPARPQPAAAAAAPATGRPMGGLGGHAGDVARHVREAFATPAAAGATAALTPPAVAGGAAARPAPTSAAIAALLRRPALLRELVIAREILDRPEHRW